MKITLPNEMQYAGGIVTDQPAYQRGLILELHCRCVCVHSCWRIVSVYNLVTVVVPDRPVLLVLSGGGLDQSMNLGGSLM